MSTPDGGEREERGPAATRVVVSYPADLSERGRGTVEGVPFRAYLRKTMGRVEAGGTFEEFVGVGCCGSTHDVSLRVESVEGGDRVDEDTAIEFAVRGVERSETPDTER